MTAIALQPGEVLGPATSLPDELSAAARAELTLALGRAPQPSELAGLVRRGDGHTWLLSYRVPAVSKAELGDLVDRPWAYMGGGVGMRFVTLHGSIAEVAPILLDPTSGHTECRRREALYEQMQRDLHERQECERAERRIAGAAEAAERQRKERARQDFREDDWGPLPPASKLAYLVALAIDDGKDVASELRRLAAELAKRGTLAFPGRRWW